MRGAHQPPINRRPYELLDRALPREIEARGNPLLSIVDGAQILGPAKVLCGLAQQQHRVPLHLEARSHHAFYIIDQAHHPDHRSRVDGQAVSFIIKAHVPAYHWDLKRLAGIRNTLDTQDELPHDIRALGIPEIQAVRERQRPSTDTGEISGRLRDGTGCSRIGIKHAVEAVAVCGQCQRLAGTFDPYHRRVGSRTDDGIGLDHMVVLLKHPAFMGDGGRREQGL